MISKIEVERFTLTSSKPFDQVVAALNSAVGHPDMSEFWKSTDRAQSVAELQSTIEKVLGRTGLMLFAEFDHGAIVRKGTERPDGVHLSYDRMASFLAPYQNVAALNVARELDAKVEALLASAAA